MRLRYEADHDRISGEDARHRGRVRVRIGGTFDVMQDVVAGLRIRTGDKHNANSPYADLGSDFSSFEVVQHLAYVDWAPGAAPGLVLTGGKMLTGFAKTRIYGDLTWDDDVNPEGSRVTICTSPRRWGGLRRVWQSRRWGGAGGTSGGPLGPIPARP